MMTGLADDLVSAMRHLSARQRVIADNLANSETPGFKAREIDAPDFGALVEAGGAPHIARPKVGATALMTRLGARSGSAERVIADQDISETKPDGNNVTIEDQLLKLGEIQADFATLTSLYRKQQLLLKIALGRTGGN